MKRPLCLICLAFVLALYCYMEWTPRPSYELEAYDGRVVELTGQVYQKEIKQEQIILYINQVTFCDEQSQLKQENNHKVIGICKDAGTDVNIGSYVQIRGRIQQFQSATNPGEFDMRRYYHILGIDVQMKDTIVEKQSVSYSKRLEFLYKMRNYLSCIYDKYLDEKDAATMKAMVLGEKQAMDKDSRNLYQKAGIVHVLAISGLHISMIGMAIYTLLRKVNLPLPICVAISIFLMLQYGDMTGMSSSAYRAIMMFSMRILSICVRRAYDMLTAMMISCMLILVESPMYIYHSGFQLSFGAMIGIGLMNPVFCNRYLPGKEELKYRFGNDLMAELLFYLNKLKYSLQGSLAITSIHLPILLTQYYSFPIYSIFLNLIIIPLMTLLLGAGLVLLLIGQFVDRLVHLPASIIHLILYLYEQLAKLTVDCLMGQWITGCPNVYQIILYLLIVGLLLYMRDRLPLYLRYMYFLAGVIVLTVTVRFGEQITILDVGQGDAICMETQEGHCYLIDGGSSSKKNVGTYQMIPFLKYRGIDEIKGIFLTHLDDDHISGVKELIKNQKQEGIRVRNVILAKSVIRDEAYLEMLDLCQEYHVAVRLIQTGDALCDGRLKIQCLFPQEKFQSDDRNAASLVLQVSCGNFNGLFTGDVGEEGEMAVAKELQAVHSKPYQLFKATHHGSKYSNTWQLLEQLQPQLTIISCGRNNRYGHPHEEALQRLEAVGTRLVRTDENGAVMIHIFGNRCKVKVFK